MTSILNFIHGGGFVMYPLLLLSLTAIVVIAERVLAFAQFGRMASGLLPQVLALCRKGQYQEALSACESQRGPLAACLSVILQHHSQPIREMERMAEETGQEYFIKLEFLLPVLDTTTTIAPLLGLLGTIVGMIGAFNAIALQQQHGNNDSVLAGVGTALYATATGLVIAVVCFAAYNYFAARLRTITAQTEQAATKLINVLVEQHHKERSGQGSGLMPESKEESHGIQTAARA
jgi:biopolymer transport protein ExbB